MNKKLFVKYILVFLLFSSGINNIFSQIIETRPLITVTGEAAEKTLPDLAVIRYIITTRTTAQEIISLFSTERDNLDIDMKFISISDKDYIRSIDMLRKDGSMYILVREFIITLTNLDKYREVIYRILKLGKGDIESIDFRTSRLTELKNTARDKAVKAAREKAAAMVSALNQEIGKAFTIIENNTAVINWYQNMFERKNLDLNLGNDVYLVQPGYISVTANVKVSFELK